MTKSKSVSWPLFAVTLLLTAACGKKDDGASAQPSISAPAPVEKVTAQAEVKASSGPIELALLLHKDRIRAGESLWHQIRIRNVGDKEITIWDQIFHEPRELRKQSSSKYRIYVEAIGSDGKPLDVEFRTPAERTSDLINGVSGLLEVEGPQERAMLDAWKKQGLSAGEINNRLIEFNSKKQRAAEPPLNLPSVKLLPGQSVETKSAFFPSMQDKVHNRPFPRRIGEFAQLDFFVLEDPGVFKIRAVYDYAPTSSSAAYQEDVKFKTPWISFEVLP